MKGFDIKPRHYRVQRGASLVEYALLVALLAMASIAAVSYLGSAIDGSLRLSKNQMDGATGICPTSPEDCMGGGMN